MQRLMLQTDDDETARPGAPQMKGMQDPRNGDKMRSKCGHWQEGKISTSCGEGVEKLAGSRRLEDPEWRGNPPQAGLALNARSILYRGRGAS